MNRKILIITLFSLMTFGSHAQSSHKYSRKEVLSDLQFLYSSLKEAHYNVFAYISEPEFDSKYQKEKSSIDQDSLSLLETTNIFQRLTSAINNGHTEIDFPGQVYSEYAYGGGTVFPIEIAFENDSCLVRKNFSDKASIKPGDEIISINGEPVSRILSKIYPQLSAERLYFKNAKVEMYSFPRLYWQVYGSQDQFEIEIRSDNSIKKYTLAAINLIEGYEMKRTEIMNASMQLKFYGASAYLNPGNFSGDENKYRRFIDSSFVQIKENHSNNLIIDLRNNFGGNNSFSDYLVSYFANKPFKWNSEFTLKTSSFLKEHTKKHYDTTDNFFRQILDHKDGEIYRYDFKEVNPRPEEQRFKGKVYVLINRQSHSQSAVAAAQLQDYGFGTLVGEETGEFPSLYASQFSYSLPRTGIQVKLSKGYIVRVNGQKDKKGVIPDIFIKDRLLDEHDEILEGLLQKINNK